MPETIDPRLDEYAQRLLLARKTRRSMSRLTIEDPDISLHDAYEIQRIFVGSSRRAGFKVGLTSVARQLELGIATPAHGVLLVKEAVENGGTLNRKKLIHPRVEPNLVFMLKQAIPKNATTDQIREAVGAVHVGLDITDSRFIFSMYALQDFIADNTSAAGHVIGGRIKCPLDKLGDLEVWIGRRGIAVHKGTGAAILGDPIRSLENLVRMMGTVPAGPVFAGAATPSIPVHPNDTIEAGCAGGATVSFRVD